MRKRTLPPADQKMAKVVLQFLRAHKLDRTIQAYASEFGEAYPDFQLVEENRVQLRRSWAAKLASANSGSVSSIDSAGSSSSTEKRAKMLPKNKAVCSKASQAAPINSFKPKKTLDDSSSESSSESSDSDEDCNNKECKRGKQKNKESISNPPLESGDPKPKKRSYFSDSSESSDSSTSSDSFPIEQKKTPDRTASSEDQLQSLKGALARLGKLRSTEESHRCDEAKGSTAFHARQTRMERRSGRKKDTEETPINEVKKNRSLRRSVSFSDEDEVTEIPRVDVHEKPDLFYNKNDIRRFTVEETTRRQQEQVEKMEAMIKNFNIPT